MRQRGGKVQNPERCGENLRLGPSKDTVRSTSGIRPGFEPQLRAPGLYQRATVSRQLIAAYSEPSTVPIQEIIV